MLILKDNIFKNDQTARMLKETDWVEKKVQELDKQISKDGYKWMHLRINDDGSVEVRHVGEKEPDTVDEDSVVAENKSDRKRKVKDIPRDKSPSVSGEVKREQLAKKSNLHLESTVRTSEDKKDIKSEEDHLDSLGYLEDSSRSDLKEEAENSILAARSEKGTAKSDKEKAERRLAAAKAPAPAKTDLPLEGSSGMKNRSKTGTPKQAQFKAAESQPATSALDKNIQIEITQYPILLKIGKLHKPDLNRIMQNSITAILTVNTEGIVEAAELIEGTGIESIDQKVMNLLKKAKFEPAYTKKGPVSYTFKIKLDLK
jgi:TonB family protein